MASLLRKGISLQVALQLMKIRRVCPRQKHVEEAITPLPSTIHMVMAFVVFGEMEATESLWRMILISKDEVDSAIANLLPCVLPVPLTEVKVNVLMYLGQTIVFGLKLMDALIALQFQLIEGLLISAEGYANTLVAPGMATLASKFSGGSPSHIVM